MTTHVRHGVSLLTDLDIYLFKEGTHLHLHEKLGAHLMTVDGALGTLFAVWAPNAGHVSVIGDFNNWDGAAHPLQARNDGSGIWEGLIPGIGPGAAYRYRIVSRLDGHTADKGDPFARRWETPPKTASVVWDTDYRWDDEDWLKYRRESNVLTRPMSIYEVHLGSWRRVPEEDSRSLSYRELAVQLGDYAQRMNFTHVELLPVMEHLFDGSWGYQTTGYFAPTARYGTPEDFMLLVDQLHQRGIGVILDWVPSYFPTDAHGLGIFDGTHLFEPADPQQGFHPELKNCIFDYGRNEVRAFLASSALFWLETFHADALRVDAVDSMLYLDYARKKGEWTPNKFGGRENLDAIDFVRKLNEAVDAEGSGAQMIAEESTAWPMVSHPTHVGGLGFGMKWNMVWMHDTLDYFSQDPVYRKFHHDRLSFSILYAFAENFVLPLSHKEVVHGKGSLLGKMPGDDWQRLANLRLLLGYLYAHPGKKLLFMGAELGQWNEWSHDASLDWHLLERPPHQGVARWVEDLNRVYRQEPALHQLDFQAEGFEWVDCHDWEQSTLSFLRKGGYQEDLMLVVCNFTPVPRMNYRVGVPRGGFWRELLNSDASLYGGSGEGSMGGMEAAPLPAHGRFHSLTVNLPPLGVVMFKPGPS